jgi:tRNA-Thr(GGU) m(6)t(6)A37 methyltransferase TsaA
VKDIVLEPIGTVESPVRERRDESWGAVEATIRVRADYRAGLRGLESFSHALIVTYLHEARFEAARHLVRRPRGLAEMPAVGIFAQRAKDRPNPLGVTAVRIVRVLDGALVVRGLDAIDGTPVLDIKPYYPVFDRVDGATVPSWVDQLMKGYL